MFQPTMKQRKAFLTAAVTAIVYFSFRFLLPLFLPFLISYLMALFLRPSAVWLERRLQFRIGGRRFGVPIGLIGGVQLLVIGALLGVLGYLGGLRLFQEADRLAEAVPEWFRSLDLKLTELCRLTESFCRLEDGVLVQMVREMLLETAGTIKSALMPELVFNSIGAVTFLVKALVFSVVLVIAVILSLQEMDELRSRRYRSLFHREFFLLGRRLCLTGSAWLKTQAVILFVTSCLCVAALTFMGNPYAVLAGIGIGLLDALPIFGVGTALIPWGLILLLQQQWGQAVLILGLDLACYFFREFTEARLMGKKVGLSALETLVSIYAGLKLFGGLGFILGPVGLLIIRDFVEEYDRDNPKKLLYNDSKER